MFRFKKFRRTLDAEMKDSTKCGVAQASKRAAKAEITEEEEAKLWDMKLLGSYSAESLLHTVYYFNGKLFGLRAGEHRLLRLANIIVKENIIIFDESCSKTYGGGLDDLKNKPRYIEHECHAMGEVHNPCLSSIYQLYIDKVRKLAGKIESFYFRPNRSGLFEYEEVPIGICTLNKILPVKLCEKAGLPRRTAHCLRVTCASRLFQNGVAEKLIRERTGHKSNALFLYEKGSKAQLQNVSKCLGPVNDTGKSEFTEPCTALEEYMSDPIDDLFDLNFDDYVSDSVLASIPLPENENSGNTNRSSNGENICTNSVFNNCTINFVVNEKN